MERCDECKGSFPSTELAVWFVYSGGEKVELNPCEIYEGSLRYL